MVEIVLLLLLLLQQKEIDSVRQTLKVRKFHIRSILNDFYEFDSIEAQKINKVRIRFDIKYKQK